MVIIPDQSTTITTEVVIRLNNTSFILKELSNDELRITKITDSAERLEIEPISNNVIIIK